MTRASRRCWRQLASASELPEPPSSGRELLHPRPDRRHRRRVDRPRRHEPHAQRIDRHAAAIDFVMKVRAGRQAGRADIADQLARAGRSCPARPPCSTCGCSWSPCRRRARSAPGGHSRRPSRRGYDLAVGGGADRRAPAGAEIHSAVHPREAQDRVDAKAEARGDRRVDRPRHARCRLGARRRSSRH